MIVNYAMFYIACAKAGYKVTNAIKKAGLTTNVLSRIKHKKNINAETVGKIAKVLGVEVEYLIKE